MAKTRRPVAAAIGLEICIICALIFILRAHTTESAANTAVTSTIQSITTQESLMTTTEPPTVISTTTETPTTAPSTTAPTNTKLGAGNTKDVLIDPDKYYYNADELATGLLYDLAPLSAYFVEAQETYGIDAVFLAAVAAEESGWGRYQFRRNNIFGFERCDFDSLSECIDHAANWIHTQYLTPSGLYYNGVSVAAVNIRYNGSCNWEDNVSAIMGQIIARIERVDG